MKRILVVEDEPALRKALIKGISLHGFEVDGAGDGQTALDRYYEQQYDLIVLDLNLPQIDGMALLQEFRGDDLAVKILILSARSELEDKVEGLNRGANDYLAKPFEFAELLARIEALLRREFLQHSKHIAVGDYVLDTAQHTLRYREEMISMTPKEYDLLLLLFTNQTRCLETVTLLDYLWEDESGTVEKLKVMLNRLRKKLPTELLKNQWGVGYYVSAD